MTDTDSQPTRDDLRSYAAERVQDLAPPLLIEAELRAMGATKRQAGDAMKHAGEIIERNLDEDDIHAVRQAILASASERMTTMRKRLLEREQDLEETTDRRMRLAIHRTFVSYLNLAHRTHRDLAVAFLPKEVRQEVREPTDEEIDEAALKSLR